MDIRLHKQAATTPKIRAEIQAAPAHITDTVLAERFGVSDMTIRRWRHRDDVYYRPHTRNNLKATLNHEQEEVLIAARNFFVSGSTTCSSSPGSSCTPRYPERHSTGC